MAKSILQQINDVNIKTAAANRFRVTDISRHTHTGINSPPVYQPILTYVGEIDHTGSPLLFPSGWSITHPDTGVYVITHNLNSLLYAVTVTAYDSGSYITAVASKNTGYITVSTGTSSTGSATDNGFMFLLTVVSNQSSQLPTYSGIETAQQ